MYSIIGSATEQQHLSQFRDWLEEEWGTVDPFEGPVEGFAVPSPILAVDEHVLLGGLGFTSFSKPGSAEIGVWINTLLVAPMYRNTGIGSKLVQAAEAEAIRIKALELFVCTGIPNLYLNLKWTIVGNTNDSMVLRRILTNG